MKGKARAQLHTFVRRRPWGSRVRHAGGVRVEEKEERVWALGSLSGPAADLFDSARSGPPSTWPCAPGTSGCVVDSPARMAAYSDSLNVHRQTSRQTPME